MWHSRLLLLIYDHDCFANTFIYLCWQEHNTNPNPVDQMLIYLLIFISFGLFFQSLYINNKGYLSVPSETADVPVMTHTKCL